MRSIFDEERLYGKGTYDNQGRHIYRSYGSKFSPDLPYESSYHVAYNDDPFAIWMIGIIKLVVIVSIIAFVLGMIGYETIPTEGWILIAILAGITYYNIQKKINDFKRRQIPPTTSAELATWLANHGFEGPVPYHEVEGKEIIFKIASIYDPGSHFRHDFLCETEDIEEGSLVQVEIYDNVTTRRVGKISTRKLSEFEVIPAFKYKTTKLADRKATTFYSESGRMIF